MEKKLDYHRRFPHQKLGINISMRGSEDEILSLTLEFSSSLFKSIDEELSFTLAASITLATLDSMI